MNKVFPELTPREWIKHKWRFFICPRVFKTNKDSLGISSSILWKIDPEKDKFIYEKVVKKILTETEISKKLIEFACIEKLRLIKILLLRKGMFIPEELCFLIIKILCEGEFLLLREEFSKYLDYTFKTPIDCRPTNFLGTADYSQNLILGTSNILPGMNRHPIYGDEWVNTSTGEMYFYHSGMKTGWYKDF